MEQEDQQSIVLNKNILTIFTIVVGIFSVLLVTGFMVYCWREYGSKKPLLGLKQKETLNLENSREASAFPLQDRELASLKPKSFAIPEIGIKVSFPNDYSLRKNYEKNRRGSFVSYDFWGDYQPPYLDEIQFFSKESIENFTKSCVNELCFEGDYPDVARYIGQKSSFEQSKDYNNFKLRKFGSRSWFVSNFNCIGDSCVIREYTTFLGNTKVDVSITMTDLTEEKQADIVFSQFTID